MLRADDPHLALAPMIECALHRSLEYVQDARITSIMWFNYWQLEFFLHEAFVGGTPTPFNCADIIRHIQDCQAKSERGIRWTPPQPPPQSCSQAA